MVTGASSYTIELNTAADFTGTSIVKTSSSRVINFAGLVAGTPYYNRVQTNLMPGQWGQTRSFTTLGSGARLSSEGNTAEENIEETEEAFKVEVFGNPFSNRLSFRIGCACPQIQQASIKLIDLSGRIVHESFESTNVRIDIEKAFSQGLYILQVQSEEYIETVRVIKVD